MAATLRIVSKKDGAFGYLSADAPADAEAAPLSHWDSIGCGDFGQAGRIVRRRPGRGYVINEGPRTLRIVYIFNGESVGPLCTFLAPGHCCELGIGEGVMWMFFSEV